MVATRRHPAGDFSNPTTTTPTASPSKPSKPTSTNTRSSSSSSNYTHLAPYPMTLWLLISLPLVLWDTLYVFLRPHSMPGGKLHSPLWTPYALYGTVDHVYGWPAWRERGGFTAAQASLNVVETVIYGWYVWVLWTSGRRRGRVTESEGSGGGIGWFVGWSEEGRRKVVQGPGVVLAVVLVFAGAVMTVSKTVLYLLHEYYSGFANVGHNDIVTLVIYWVIPNGAWLVLPSYMVYVLGKEILDALDGNDGKRR